MLLCIFLPELGNELFLDLRVDLVSLGWEKSVVWESSVDWEWENVLFVLHLLVALGVVQSGVELCGSQLSDVGSLSFDHVLSLGISLGHAGFELSVFSPDTFVFSEGTRSDGKLSELLVLVFSLLLNPVFSLMADFSTKARLRGKLKIVLEFRMVQNLKNFFDTDNLFLNVDDIGFLVFWKVSNPATKFLVSVTNVIKNKLSTLFGISLVKSFPDDFEDSSFLLAFVKKDFLHDHL